MERKSIVITDEYIVNFYNNNTTIDIDTINRMFISIIQNLSSNLTETLNTNVNSQILSLVSDIHSNINTMRTDIILKFHDSKKEYVDAIKLIIDNNSLTNNEKINSVLEKSHDNLITKTTLIINDIVPKSQEKNYSQIENCVKTFCNTITQDTAKLLQHTQTDNNQLTNVVSSIESNFSKMISNIQQPIFSFIQSSEERTSHNMQQVKENLLTQQSQQNLLTTELNDFLNKYKHNSSTKGNVSEAELYYILQSIMPTDEIIKVAGITATCDYKVNRRDPLKATILFENKDYGRSVTTDEVKKFERDLQLQKLHGIFISQNSPITFKNDFQIDIIEGLIHIYIPKADYDANKIKVAIDIIDSLSIRLQQISHQQNVDEISISKEDLDDIIGEYHIFVSHKLQMMETIKSITKQLVDKLDEIQLPKLKQMFVKFGAIDTDTDFKCSHCNLWTGKNKASLGAHIRNCKSNTVKNKEIQPVVIEGIVLPEPEQINTVVNKSSKKTKTSSKV